MSEQVERSAEWIYRGVWHVLVDCFRVPQHPPNMPVSPTDFCLTFHPSRKYLSYLKLYFWIALFVIDVAILVGWIAIFLANPALGWILAAPALFIAIVPDIVAYIAIHLRYDTMWYVMTDRSLRARRGIWVIVEHTVTFENVQNVYVRRGPVQQLFGISEVVLETAGASAGEGENVFEVGNKAIMEGIENPEEIKAMIMERVNASRSAGLGDERSTGAQLNGSTQDRRQVQVLEEIRDDLRAMA